MDLVHQNSSSTGLGICSSLGVVSVDNRMPSNYNSTGSNSGPLSPNLSSMKQCRSTPEVEVDAREEGGPLKLARKDSFSYRPSEQQQQQQQQQQQHHQHQQHQQGKLNMNGGHAGGAANNNAGGPAGSNSFSGDNGGSRIACSPTNSCLSDGVLVASDAAANLMGDTRILRNDATGMAAASAGYLGAGAAAAQATNMRPFSYQSYQYPGAAGSPLMLAAAAAARGDHLGMQSAMGMRGPFTANQWAELEHQALIFKYMMAGASVPPELLNPIRRSVALNNLASSHPSLRMGWGNFHLGIPNNPDPEPGRCRRTDGKKWRCSREVVPDQKYCDRHMHRGRNRSKKNAENQAAAANSQAAAAAAAAAAATGGGAVGAAGAPGAPSGGGSTLSGGNVGVQTSSLNQIHSGLRPPLGMNGQNTHAAAAASASPYNTNKSNFSPLPTGIPSNNSPSSLQFPMQSLSGASPGGNKDYRYMNGMNKPELGLGPEQLLFSDAPPSSSVQQSSWQQNLQSKFPRLSSNSSSSSSSPNSNTSSPLYPQQHHPAQLRTLSGQHFGMSEGNQINPSQQPLLSSGGYGAMDHVGRDSEEQPLRHFFDDWPRQRDPSTLSWNDLDDEKQHRSVSTGTTTTTTTTSSATQLSISLPMSSSDFRVASSPRGKLSLSPLKLSMSRSESEEDQLSGGAADPTRMGLGVGVGISQQHQHRPWMHTLEGGPLAEVVLQSSSASTPRDCKSSPGLNLLGDGWESSSRENSRMASPTAVLAKTPFGSFSDSSSNASSPRAVHAEAAALLSGSKQLT